MNFKTIREISSNNQQYPIHAAALYNHSTGGCSNENQLLNFNILKLLGDNYEVTIYINSLRTTATLISNKVSVEILDYNFSNNFYRPASNHYASK